MQNRERLYEMTGMGLRGRDYVNAKNVAKLQIARAILRRVLCVQGREEEDRLAALRRIDRLIEIYENKCGGRD